MAPLAAHSGLAQIIRQNHQLLSGLTFLIITIITKCNDSVGSITISRDRLRGSGYFNIEDFPPSSSPIYLLFIFHRPGIILPDLAIKLGLAQTSEKSKFTEKSVKI